MIGRNRHDQRRADDPDSPTEQEVEALVLRANELLDDLRDTFVEIQQLLRQREDEKK